MSKGIAVQHNQGFFTLRGLRSNARWAKKHRLEVFMAVLFLGHPATLAMAS